MSVFHPTPIFTNFAKFSSISANSLKEHTIFTNSLKESMSFHHFSSLFTTSRQFSTNFCQFLSISRNSHQLPPISANFHQFHKIFVNLCQFVPISANFNQSHSISDNSLKETGNQLKETSNSLKANSQLISRGFLHFVFNFAPTPTTTSQLLPYLGSFFTAPTISIRRVNPIILSFTQTKNTFGREPIRPTPNLSSEARRRLLAFQQTQACGQSEADTLVIVASELQNPNVLY